MGHEAMIDPDNFMAVGLTQSRPSLYDGETQCCAEPPWRERRTRTDHRVGDSTDASQ